MDSHRFVDKAPYYFDYYHVLKTTEIWLQCSKCNQLATLKERNEEVFLTCQTCFKRDKIKEHADKIYIHRYTGLCGNCGKYIKYDLEESTYPIITKSCTNCGEMNPLTLQKNEPLSYRYKKMKFLENGQDPLTGKPLYFLDSFKGEKIWALNLEHLNYLIAYVTAALRERDESIPSWKTAGHTIPKFMKIAKNREAILHKLNKMKQKALGRYE